MSILLATPNKTQNAWLQAFRQQAPDIRVQPWSEVDNPESVRLAMVWKQAPMSWTPFSGLQLIYSIGAGVDHLLSDSSLPCHVPICRLVDDHLRNAMVRYCLTALLEHHSAFQAYQTIQSQHRWQPLSIVEPLHTSVAVLGCGQMGSGVAEALSGLGFRVHTWSRHSATILGTFHYHGDDQLMACLDQVDYLINLLPLTTRTSGILNHRIFQQLAAGAYLIQAGRGEHLVETHLLKALNSGQLSGACLDTFIEEPLSENHPFWNHPKIRITPHIAAITRTDATVAQIIDIYRRLLRGIPAKKVVLPEQWVDRKRGY